MHQFNHQSHSRSCYLAKSTLILPCWPPVPPRTTTALWTPHCTPNYKAISTVCLYFKRHKTFITDSEEGWLILSTINGKMFLFLSGALECITQSPSTLQQPRNEPWGEFFFFFFLMFFLCQRLFPRWSAKFNLNFKDGKSFWALGGKCDSEQVPSAEKNVRCNQKWEIPWSRGNTFKL